jgi:hypothetical protein
MIISESRLRPHAPNRFADLLIIIGRRAPQANPNVEKALAIMRL